MPGLPPGNDFVFFWVAGLEVVFAGDLEPCLGGFGAAGDEEYAVEVAGGHGGEFVGQIDLRLSEEAGVGETDFVGLALHCGGDFGHAMADGDDVYAGAGVEVGAAVFGVEVAVLAVGDLRPVVSDDAMEDAVGRNRHGL